MRMLNPIKAGLVALLLSVLAACQSPPQGLTAEQIAALKEQGFHLTDEGWTLDISNKVLFANNVGALNPETRQVVEKLGKALIEVGLNRARVDGHTDSNGDEAYNQQLSLYATGEPGYPRPRRRGAHRRQRDRCRASGKSTGCHHHRQWLTPVSRYRRGAPIGSLESTA